MPAEGPEERNAAGKSLTEGCQNVKVKTGYTLIEPTFQAARKKV